MKVNPRISHPSTGEIYPKVLQRWAPKPLFSKNTFEAWDELLKNETEQAKQTVKDAMRAMRSESVPGTYFNRTIPNGKRRGR